MHELADASQLSSELRARKVDLLITDLDQPEQLALDRVATLRGTFPHLKLIALSAIRLIEAPGALVLPKPFHQDRLLRCVQEAFLDAAPTCRPAVEPRLV